MTLLLWLTLAASGGPNDPSEDRLPQSESRPTESEFGTGSVGVVPEKDRIWVATDVHVVDVQVDGTLDAKKGTSVIRKYLGQLKYCQEQAYKRQSAAKSYHNWERLFLAAEIQDGRVTQAESTFNTKHDESMMACMTRKVAGWRFDEGSGTIWFSIDLEITDTCD